MYRRIVENICFSDSFGRQMRFIAGPRQVGKTTISKQFLKKTNFSKLYYNWDQRIIKESYRKDPYFFQKDLFDYSKGTKKWVCFDEIHKIPKWKDILKDFFDTFENELQIIVTGSAHLDFFRKSGDSLAGRYFLFHLLPLSLKEVTGRAKIADIDLAGPSLEFIEYSISNAINHKKELQQLLKFGPFPEPYKNSSETFLFKWQNDYIDRLIREDLRDLTRIIELENVATLIKLLPEKVGAPLSLNSLREDLAISHAAIRNYIYALDLGYIIFFYYWTLFKKHCQGSEKGKEIISF